MKLSLQQVVRVAGIVSHGAEVISALAPVVIEAMEQRDYEAMAAYAGVLASGRKIGLASERTVEAFVRAISSLVVDIKERRANHPLSIFQELGR